MMMLARLMVQRLPANAELLGYIDRHPTDDHGPGYAVVRLPAAVAAWDGETIRSLPRDWRERVQFEPA